MMLDLLVVELKRTWILTKRYPMELMSGLTLMIIGFYALFLGARYISGPAAQFGEELDSLILGYCLWSVVLFLVNSMALGLQSEALTGTLEQVYLSPLGGLRIILVRALAGLGLQLGSAMFMLLVLLWLTGRNLSFPPVVILPLVAVLLGACGIGLAMAALALIAKQVQQVLTLTQFALLILVVLPVESFDGSFSLIFRMLPIAAGASLLRDTMVHHAPMDLGWLLLAFCGGGACLAVGLICHRAAEGWARQNGLLGQY